MWKRWIVIIGVCLVGFLVIFFSLENRPPEEVVEAGEGDNDQDSVVVQPVVMQDTRIRGWEDGRLSWVLNAREMEFNQETTQAWCRGEVELMVFKDTGEQRAVLNAGEATINLDAQDFHFRRQVRVVSADQNRLYAHALTYRDETKVLESYTPTRTYFGDNYIESHGLVTDIDFEQPEFMEVTKGRFVIGSSRTE